MYRLALFAAVQTALNDAVWNDASAPVELKKRIIRTLINEIVVDVNHPRATIEMQIHWAGGVHTPLIVRKNKYGRNSRAVDRDVVELVRELALVQPDSYIASTLNRLGYQTGTIRMRNNCQVNQVPICTIRQNYQKKSPYICH